MPQYVAPGYDSRAVQSAAIQNILASKAANSQRISAEADRTRANVAEEMAPFQKASAIISGIKDIGSTATNIWGTYHATQASEAATKAANWKLEMDKLVAPSEWLKNELGIMGNVMKMMQEGTISQADMKRVLTGRFSDIRKRMAGQGFPQQVINVAEGWNKAIMGMVNAERYPDWHPSAGRIIPSRSSVLAGLIKEGNHTQAFVKGVTDRLSTTLSGSSLKDNPALKDALQASSRAMVDNGQSLLDGFPDMNGLRRFYREQMQQAHGGEWEPGEWEAFLNEAFDNAVRGTSDNLGLSRGVYDYYGGHKAGQANLPPPGAGGRVSGRSVGRGVGGGGGEGDRLFEEARAGFGTQTNTLVDVNALNELGDEHRTGKDGHSPGTYLRAEALNQDRNERQSNFVFDGESNAAISGEKKNKAAHNRAVSRSWIAEIVKPGDSSSLEAREFIASDGRPVVYSGPMKVFKNGTVGVVNSLSEYTGSIASRTNPNGLPQTLLLLANDGKLPFPGPQSLAEREEKAIEFPGLPISKTKEMYPPDSPEGKAQQEAMIVAQRAAMQFAWLTQTSRFSYGAMGEYMKDLLYTGGDPIERDKQWLDSIDKLKRIRDHWGANTKLGTDSDNPIDKQTYLVLDQMISALTGNGSADILGKTPKSSSLERRNFLNAGYKEWLRNPENHEDGKSQLVKIPMFGDQEFVVSKQLVAMRDHEGRVTGQTYKLRHFPLEDWLYARDNSTGHGIEARNEMLSVEAILNPEARDNAISAAGSSYALAQKAEGLRERDDDSLSVYDKALKDHYAGLGVGNSYWQGDAATELFASWGSKLNGVFIQEKMGQQLGGYASAFERRDIEKRAAEFTNPLGVDWTRSTKFWEIGKLGRQLELARNWNSDPTKSELHLTNDEMISKGLQMARLQRMFGDTKGMQETLKRLQAPLEDGGNAVKDITLLQGHKEEFQALQNQRFGAVPMEHWPDYWTVGGVTKVPPVLKYHHSRGVSWEPGKGNEFVNGKITLHGPKKTRRTYDPRSDVLDPGASGWPFESVEGQDPADLKKQGKKAAEVIKEQYGHQDTFMDAEEKNFQAVWNFLNAGNNLDPKHKNSFDDVRSLSKFLDFPQIDGRKWSRTTISSVEGFAVPVTETQPEAHLKAYAHAFRQGYFKNYEALEEGGAYGGDEGQQELTYEEKFFGHGDEGPSKPKTLLGSVEAILKADDELKTAAENIDIKEVIKILKEKEEPEEPGGPSPYPSSADLKRPTPKVIKEALQRSKDLKKIEADLRSQTGPDRSAARRRLSVAEKGRLNDYLDSLEKDREAGIGGPLSRAYKARRLDDITAQRSLNEEELTKIDDERAYYQNEIDKAYRKETGTPEFPSPTPDASKSKYFHGHPEKRPEPTTFQGKLDASRLNEYLSKVRRGGDTRSERGPEFKSWEEVDDARKQVHDRLMADLAADIDAKRIAETVHPSPLLKGRPPVMADGVDLTREAEKWRVKAYQQREGFIDPPKAPPRDQMHLWGEAEKEDAINQILQSLGLEPPNERTTFDAGSRKDYNARLQTLFGGLKEAGLAPESLVVDDVPVQGRPVGTPNAQKRLKSYFDSMQNDLLGVGSAESTWINDIINKINQTAPVVEPDTSALDMQQIWQALEERFPVSEYGGEKAAKYRQALQRLLGF
jgi:hypothetical protein